MGTTQKVIRSIFAWYERWSGAFWDRAQAEMLDAIETTAVKNNPQETPMSTRGYAIKANGAIDVRTVSPSEVGSKINWLVIQMPSFAWLNKEEAINKAFDGVAKGKGLTCIKVNIEELP